MGRRLLGCGRLRPLHASVAIMRIAPPDPPRAVGATRPAAVRRRRSRRRQSAGSWPRPVKTPRRSMSRSVIGIKRTGPPGRSPRHRRKHLARLSEWAGRMPLSSMMKALPRGLIRWSARKAPSELRPTSMPRTPPSGMWRTMVRPGTPKAGNMCSTVVAMPSLFSPVRNQISSRGSAVGPTGRCSRTRPPELRKRQVSSRCPATAASPRAPRTVRLAARAAPDAVRRSWHRVEHLEQSAVRAAGQNRAGLGNTSSKPRNDASAGVIVEPVPGQCRAAAALSRSSHRAGLQVRRSVPLYVR